MDGAPVAAGMRAAAADGMWEATVAVHGHWRQVGVALDTLEKQVEAVVCSNALVNVVSITTGGTEQKFT